MHLKSSTSRAAFTAVLSLIAAPAVAETQHVVTAVSGDGSIYAAMAAANSGTGAQKIVVAVEGDITLDGPLVYEGAAPLTIIGNGQTLSLSQNATILTAANGADLTVHGLTLSGPGGFDIENRGDTDGAAGKGIFVDVRDHQTGTVRLTLSDVTVEDTAGHGIHVSDCSLADDCGGGGGGAGEGSDASISVVLSNVIVQNVGYGRFDADGLRVDERSIGDISLAAVNASFIGVGADGAELDEGQAGDVIVHVTGGSFASNGGYCDPELLSAFMPAEPEGEFDEGAVQEADIPGPITGTPDDGCFEREVGTYDDGSVEEYEFAIDVDDGSEIEGVDVSEM